MSDERRRHRARLRQFVRKLERFEDNARNVDEASQTPWRAKHAFDAGKLIDTDVEFAEFGCEIHDDE